VTTTTAPLFTTRDVVAAVGRAATGAAMVGVGWYEASDHYRLDDQAPWLALAIGGLLVAAAGGIGWILALRRSVADGLRAMHESMAALPRPPGGDTAGTSEVVVLRTGAPRLFHLSGCPLVRDRAVRRTTPAAELAAGREACEACDV
jgi:hypothetical protein